MRPLSTKARKPILIVGVLFLAVFAFACGGTEGGQVGASGDATNVDATGPEPGETATTILPEGLKGVIGLDVVDVDRRLWYMSDAGNVTSDEAILDGIVVKGDVSAGATTSMVAFVGAEEGQETFHVYVWRPAESASSARGPQKLSLDLVGDLGSVLLSPDERTLVVLTGEITDPALDAALTRVYGVDLVSGVVTRWEWMESMISGGGGVLTALVWSDDSRFLYASLGPPSGSIGERSYRCNPADGTFEEIPGMAAVLDVGPDGQVLGHAAGPSVDVEVGGALSGWLPLVVWEAGATTRLPYAADVFSRAQAWFSADARTVVAEVGVLVKEGTEKTQSGLEVLKLSGEEWVLSDLVTASSPEARQIRGIGFESDSGIFWAQAERRLEQGVDAGPAYLIEVDTGTNEVRAVTSAVLPGTLPHAQAVVSE